MFIIRLENLSKKIHCSSKVNHVKIFFAESVSSQTQVSYEKNKT